jgi:ribonuclease D
MTSVAHHAIDSFHLYEGDLPEPVYAAFAAQPRIAWDTETSGLDWQTERIALCQLYAPGTPAAVVRIGDHVPEHLRQLLADAPTRKVFHHAMFDLRFMAHAWDVEPRNVACTKIAAKLLFPDQPQQQQLRALLARFIGLQIDKTQQRSNWFAAALAPEQLEYAVRDVIHLPELLDHLLGLLEAQGLDRLATRCFDHLPTRVRLELGSFGDVFTY